MRKRPINETLRLAAASVLMLLVFLFVPGWFAHRLPSVKGIRYALRYQAQLREQFSALIQREGGAANILKCGSVMTNNYQVTMLAWYLDVPIPWVQSLPHKALTKQGPNVVFQDGAINPKNSGPTAAQMAAWERGWQNLNNSHYKIIKPNSVTLYMDCSTYSSPASYTGES